MNQTEYDGTAMRKTEIIIFDWMDENGMQIGMFKDLPVFVDGGSAEPILGKAYICNLRKSTAEEAYLATILREYKPKEYEEIDDDEFVFHDKENLTFQEKIRRNVDALGHYSIIDDEFIIDNNLETGHYIVRFNAKGTVALFSKHPRGQYYCDDGIMWIGMFLRKHTPAGFECRNYEGIEGVAVDLEEVGTSSIQIGFWDPSGKTA